MTRAGNGNDGRLKAAWRRHERRWRNNRYVYAVVSRRSGGVSIGLNLNPDRKCNFDCVYCQVDRKSIPIQRRVLLARLSRELDRILQAEKNGSLYEDPPFDALRPEERGVRDIAFSGDGEPTTFRGFGEAVRIAADARNMFGLNSTKLVLLTNAACLDIPSVRAALGMLDANNGEIWAKLDAGTEEYFRAVNRTRVPLNRILRNILEASRVRPMVIQTLWFRIHGAVPPEEEIEAYIGCLKGLISSGGQLAKIQFHTIARVPAEAYATPLSDVELERIVSKAKSKIPVSIDAFYSG